MSSEGIGQMGEVVQGPSLAGLPYSPTDPFLDQGGSMCQAGGGAAAFSSPDSSPPLHALKTADGARSF